MRRGSGFVEARDDASAPSDVASGPYRTPGSAGTAASPRGGVERLLESMKPTPVMFGSTPCSHFAVEAERREVLHRHTATNDHVLTAAPAVLVDRYAAPSVPLKLMTH